MERKNILVTGGMGYIGSHTVIKLVEYGYNPIIIDNLANSSEKVLPRLEKITGTKIAFYKGDVCNREDVDKVLSENKIDAVIHFAGLKAVGESVQKPVEYYRNNLDSTLTLLEEMPKYGVKNTSMFELSCHVHYAKTDKTDARGICKFLSKNEDIRPYAIVSYHTRQLRALYRERTKLNKRLNQDINRLKGQLHIAFPELLDKKHATIGPFELEFLSRYPTADSIRNMKTGKLVASFSKVKYMRIDIARAGRLIEAAKTSIGCSALAEGFVIKEMLMLK